MLHSYTMVKTPHIELKSYKIIKILIAYIYLLLYTERSEVENPLNTGRNNIMYNVYRLIPGISRRSTVVKDRPAAELLCVNANNRINEDRIEGRYLLLYMEQDCEKKVVNGMQYSETEFLVSEFNAIKGNLVASFTSPLDAVNYCNGMDNYCYAFSPHDASSFMIVCE